tara:strand:+ start:27 stop:554 length:528 start_codon:yes stop_codon:yes gene_type:complete
MDIKNTNLNGVQIIKPDVHSDERGHFKEVFKESFIGDFSVKQINQAFSYGKCMRGLHFQKTPYEQGKLIWCSLGKILDVVVDINRNSPTFKQYFSIELSDTNHLILLIPKGYAHGYLTLSDKNIVCYGVDELYAPDHDAGLRFQDPQINLKLGYDLSEFLISEKDKELPLLRDIK